MMGRGGRRILVLDDDEPVLSMMTDLLQEEGHRVVAVATIAAARAFLATARPDLIISDVLVWQLPVLDLASRLAADTQCSGIPILLFTALIGAEVDTLRAGLPAGMDLLAKPFAIEELLERIEQLLALHEPRDCEE